jgi:thiol-disulfide isomerase/thioredoxin
MMPLSLFARSALATALLALAPSLSAQKAPALLQAGAVAPDFVSKDLAGTEIRLANYAGKVVVLDFWATWCGPCIQSLPHVQEVAKEQKEHGVVVLAVCTSDSRVRYEAWMKDNAAKYPDIVFTCDPFDRGSKQFEERASSSLYHVSGLPTKFVVGKDGKITAAIVGSEEGDARLEAGLARAGVTIDAELAARGEAQAQKAAKEDAARAAALAANPPLPFMKQLGGLKSGAAMPDATLVGADGKEFSLASLRGKATILAMAWHDIMPWQKLNELSEHYRHYGVETTAAMVFTKPSDFDTWSKEHGSDCKFRIGCDPLGTYQGEATDNDARMAHHRATVVGKIFGGGGYPAMPIGLVIDAEGRFVGGFRLGNELQEGLGNLLLRAGIQLDAADMPSKVASAEDFVIAPPPAPEAKVERLAIGAMAPDFEGQDLAGKPIKLSDYRGKVIVLDFWATWCGPCKASLPHTQEVARHYKDQDVVVLANCTSDTRKAFEAWLQQNQGDYPDIVFHHDPAEKGPERASRKLYGVAGIPQQFVIGKDGKVAAVVDGYIAGEVLLEGALAKAGVVVDAATLEKAAADQQKRDASKPKSVRMGEPAKMR